MTHWLSKKLFMREAVFPTICMKSKVIASMSRKAISRLYASQPYGTPPTGNSNALINS